MNMFILLLLLAALPMFGQFGCYEVRREFTNPTAGTALTVQQPAAASANRDARIVSVSMWASVDTTFTVERTGTAASATATTPVAISSGQSAPKLNGFYSSNVGSGTRIGPSYYYKQNTAAIVVSFTDTGAGGVLLRHDGGTGENFSAKVASSITGTAEMSIIYCEYRR